VTGCGHFDFTAATPRIAELGLGVAALRYAELGCSVVPLVRGGKRPHRMLPFEREAGGGNGVHHASGSPVVTEGRWLIDPAANIGVAAGSRSSLLVVDLDVKNGQDGPGVFSQFLLQYGLRLPDPLPWVRTPSGGVHLWFRTPVRHAPDGSPWPVPVPERPGILPGVDVKGDGGLVVAPPSMALVTPASRPGEHAGAGEQVPVPYTWQGCPCQAPPAPSWLLHWAATAPAATGQAAGAGTGGIPELAELKSTGIPRGQRNTVLYRLACSLYRRLPPERVIAELREVRQAGDQSDMSDRELGVIAESDRRFIERQVRQETMLAERAAGWLNRR
jgi:hypothetical protein